MQSKVLERQLPYIASGRYPEQSQHGGQTNYGYSPNMPQQTPYTAQYTHSNNAIVTQVPSKTGIVYQPAPRDYSTQAWIACLCCFWPTALLAIMKAKESREALARGDIAGAQAAANSARTMVIISFVIGILSYVALAVVLGVYYGMAYSSVY